jgi:hypothetical protein
MVLFLLRPGHYTGKEHRGQLMLGDDLLFAAKTWGFGDYPQVV